MRAGRAAAAALLALGLSPAVAVAEPVRYVIEPTHTFPSIAFDHMGLSTWRGKFTDTEGGIVLDREAESGSVAITIDPASIAFGLDIMDEAARSADWFDVARYPEARYEGSIVFANGVPTQVDGKLTFRDVTRAVPLTITRFKCMPHPVLDVEVCGADAEGVINWAEYGMKHSDYGRGKSGRTQLRIQVEALKQR